MRVVRNIIAATAEPKALTEDVIPSAARDLWATPWIPRDARDDNVYLGRSRIRSGVILSGPVHAGVELECRSPNHKVFRRQLSAPTVP
jgi:hypothetical protein